MPDSAPKTFSVKQFKSGEWSTFDDVVSQEVPITILLDGKDPKELWAWPDELNHLAIGHVLLDMGGMGHDLSLEELDDETFAVFLEERLGACEGEPGNMTGATLMDAMQEFMGAEGMWDGTGCFHRAGLYDITNGAVLRRAEDIGRHNCIDRLAGWAHMNKVPLCNCVLLISARITASLCAKALRAGFRYMVSRSAVTTASVGMAQKHGATLVGFARDKEERFTVFTDTANRVLP